MQSKAAEFLVAIAGLMITFSGFTALLLIIRQTSGNRLSSIDRFLTRSVLNIVLILTGGALLPALLEFSEIPELWVWRMSALAFGLPLLALLLTYPKRRLAATGKPVSRFGMIVLVGLGPATLAVMIVYVLGDFRNIALAYMAALVINFFTLAFTFVQALELILGDSTTNSKRVPAECHVR
jgi:hypothetical protein